MMKKNLFILAAAALCFAACSSDETIAVNEGLADANTISFRPLMNNVTRANDAGVRDGFSTEDCFNVYAKHGSAKYFQTDFKKQSTGGFTSTTNKYYWPSDVSTNNMTFTAIYGATQVDGTPGNIASMEIPAEVASQQDILIARHTSTTVQQPVPLNFYHALSQIYVRVKNTNPNIKVTITGVRVGYIATTGAFNYDKTSTGGSTDSDGKVDQSKWTNTAAASTNKYDQTVAKSISGALAVDGDLSDGDNNALGSFLPWLLLPQNMVTDANNYGYNTGSTSVGEETKDNPDLATSYIAVKMKVQNISAASTDDEIIAAEQYHYWPISTNWDPGYKYTYMIDVANGGYYPSDRIGNDKALDPIMSPIVFDADCTVTDWDPAAEINVP